MATLPGSNGCITMSVVRCRRDAGTPVGMSAEGRIASAPLQSAKGRFRRCGDPGGRATYRCVGGHAEGRVNLGRAGSGASAAIDEIARCARRSVLT
jgi:hypothetical protein